ncbi:unnamed protein product [Calypogeia fissa]
MSSDKMEETKQSVMGKAGEANKEAKSQLDAANKSSEPSFADRAKEKAQQAKEKATAAQGKVTGAIGDGWTKTKDKFNNINQYPDKK